MTMEETVERMATKFSAYTSEASAEFRQLADHERTAIRSIAAEAYRAGEQAERDANAKLLYKHGFDAVLCGKDGFTYYQCRECKAYEPGHAHKLAASRKTAPHEDGCELAAAIRRGPSQQEKG